MSQTATLTFTIEAYLQLKAYLYGGETEIAGFAISHPDNPLLITELRVIKQQASSAYFEMDNQALIDFVADMAEQGIPPARCQRIMWHTHPGDSPKPSWLDEKEFDRIFASASWGAMFIVARNGATYARLFTTTNLGIRLEAEIPVTVDWNLERTTIPALIEIRDKVAADWKDLVSPVKPTVTVSPSSSSSGTGSTYVQSFASYLVCASALKEHPELEQYRKDWLHNKADNRSLQRFLLEEHPELYAHLMQEWWDYEPAPRVQRKKGEQSSLTFPEKQDDGGKTEFSGHLTRKAKKKLRREKAIQKHIIVPSSQSIQSEMTSIHDEDPDIIGNTVHFG